MTLYKAIKSRLLIPSFFMIFVQFLPAQSPLTIAESSDYQATSRYDDVMRFIHELQKIDQNNLRLEMIATTTEGRELPLLILSDPAPGNPNELRFSDKAVIYIQGNIHAGEVEGKEAALMLARDLLLTDKSGYLKNVVVLIAPIFNADGNEKVSKENRKRQVGPEEGVGVRYNGQNLDLNRDGLKLETPEMRGLVQNVLNRWDPALLVDCHTHNGSYHQETVTYVWNLNPNGDSSVISYMRDNMIPWIKSTLQEKYQLATTYHGDFIDPKNPEKGWQPMGPEPRYLTNYIGLRNRMAILNENYPYADYKTRVLDCLDFLLSIVEFSSEFRKEINSIIKKADQKTIQKGADRNSNSVFITEYNLNPLPDLFTLQGYEMEVVERENRRPMVKPKDKKVTYKLPYFADFVAKNSVPLPTGYLITPADKNVIDNLLQHGIVVEKLVEPIKATIETFIISEVKPGNRLNQGHYLNKINGEYVTEEKEFPAGTIFISTAQPLAMVAAYLLEPESDDGLLKWNYFDRYIVPQWGNDIKNYPVYKVYEPIKVSKIKI